MKKETREGLLTILKLHTMNLEYTLHSLFVEFYAEREFRDIDELVDGIDEFFDFFINHLHDIKFDDDSILTDEDLLEEIQNNRELIKATYNKSSLNTQSKFTDNITNSLANPEDLSLLDVGAGYHTIASLLFAKNFKKVTAMDHRFWLSTLALNNMNVQIINSHFNNESDISDYDIVVGRAPCSAIEPIVYNCSKHNKPYIIELCNCELKPELKRNTESLGWENVLPQIDPNIKFCGDYAYNVQNLDFSDAALKNFSAKIPKFEAIKSQKNNKKTNNLLINENMQDFFMNYFE